MVIVRGDRVGMRERFRYGKVLTQFVLTFRNIATTQQERNRETFGCIDWCGDRTGELAYVQCEQR